MVNIKEKGAFYTPEDIAFWMSERVLNCVNATKRVEVLEPSCGDGIFLKTLLSLARKGSCNIDAVEHDYNAFRKTSKFYDSYSNISVIKNDFLFWSTQKKYDLILGNPPYIVKKLLKSSQAEQCKKIHMQAGLVEKEVANIWTSFVVKCEALLQQNGILAFVLPTELLQVNYAKEIRDFLSDKFSRLEIISFRRLAFEGIEQDTVILIAYKNTKEPHGLYFSEVSSISDLTPKTLQFEKHHNALETKWSSYILKEDDVSFIKGISQKCKKVSDLCTSVAGIVTAANSYFILSKDEVDRYKLNKYVKKIIQKGIYVNGSVEIQERDYKALEANMKPCYLLDLNDIPAQRFTKGLLEYLEHGTSMGIPDRYKCKLRERWYDIPSIWKSEGLFFKRGHQYPKILVNKADVYVTDSAYRINMKEGADIKSFVSSFYNSLTLLSSELNGRYYGGGVLEITPNEFKGLPIPYSSLKNKEYQLFVKKFKSKPSIESFITENDSRTLLKIDGVTEKDVHRLHQLYKKVKSRRMKGDFDER